MVVAPYGETLAPPLSLHKQKTYVGFSKSYVAPSKKLRRYRRKPTTLQTNQ